MEISYFKYLGLVFAAFLLTYITGHIFYGLISEKKESDVITEFKKNVFGLWIIVVVYSIVKTVFFTINLGFIMLFFIAVVWNKTTIKRKFQSFNYEVLIFQSLVLICIYTFLYFRLYNPFTHTLYNLQVDFSIYATYIYRMNLLNAETVSTDFYYKEPIISLYHYTELWYGAFLTWVFKKNTLICLYLVVRTYALSVFCLGILSIISYFKKDKKLGAWEYILALSGLLLSPLCFYFPRSIQFFNTEWGFTSLFITPKYCFYGHSLLLATVYLQHKKYNKFLLVFLSGLFINALAIPSLFLTTVLFIALLIYLKEIGIQEIYKFIIPVFLCGAFLIIFYLFMSEHNAKYPQYVVSNPIISMLFHVQYYKFAFNNFAGLIIKFFISTLPVIFIFFYVARQNLFSITSHLSLIFLLLFAGCTMFSFSIFYFLIDGIQLWSLFYTSIMSIMISIVFALLLNQNKILFLIIFPVYVFICFYQNIIKDDDHRKEDIQFVQKIKQSVINDPRIRFGIFIRDTTAPSIAYGQNYNMYVPYDVIRLYVDNYQPIYLNAFDMPFSHDTTIAQYQKSFLTSSTFYKFVQKEKAANKFVSIEQSQLNIIRDANIKYIIKLSENRLPVSLDTLIKDRFFNIDSTYEFLILK